MIASEGNHAAASGQPRATITGAVHAVALTWRAARVTLLLYLLLTLMSAAVPVAAAWLTKLILDQLVSPATAGPAPVVLLGGALAAAGVAAVVVPQTIRYLRGEMERSVGLLAQDELFAAVERFQGLSRFEDPTFLDRLQLAQQSAGIAPNQVVDGGFSVARGALVLSGFIGSLALLSPTMTGAVLVAGVPALIAELALGRRRARMLWSIGPAQRRELFYARLLGTAEAAKEIRLFASGAFLRARMIVERRTANAAKRAMDRRELAIQGGLGLLAAGTTGAGLIWTVQAARAGRLTVGDVSLFVAAVAGVQGALSSMVGELAQAHQALLMFDHYLAVGRSEPDLPVPGRPRPVPPLQRGIELRDVWFRYSDEHAWVLRGLNLTIPSGCTVALVGRNGAGKSTLVKLLCRFYEPTRGSILWDGVDLRDVAPDELRARIGAVFQDYMCYDLTGAENIALGDLGEAGRRDRIEAAATRAGVHGTLAALPQGYDTLLSRMFFTEGDKDDPATGVVLSGGQWQRLSLARAFLRDRRDFMILDEPSSGLDAEAEHEVNARLRTCRAGLTSLLISHRLGAVRDADLVVVLDDGSIVEQGDHARLMAARGVYARLFALQAEGYRADPVPAVPAGPREGR